MHGQLPIVWNKAQDFTVSDYWGNQWIDFSSTIFVSEVFILVMVNCVFKKDVN